MARYAFLPESFEPPFLALSITDLAIALVSTRLGTSNWHANLPSAEGRSSRARMDKAIVEIEAHLLGELKAGALVAHAFVEASSSFRRIPPAYWEEESAPVSLQGSMFDLSKGRNFPEELDSTPVIIIGSRAKDWLYGEGITDTDPFFPTSLRSDVASKAVPRKARYDWPRFYEEALEQLRENGSFSGDWIQARLENHMLAWCAKRWGKSHLFGAYESMSNVSSGSFTTRREATRETNFAAQNSRQKRPN